LKSRCPQVSEQSPSARVRPLCGQPDRFHDLFIAGAPAQVPGQRLADLRVARLGPAPDEVVRARAILAAFALPENKGKGAISLDGRMVELLHADMARQTVALADAIAALSSS